MKTKLIFIGLIVFLLSLVSAIATLTSIDVVHEWGCENNLSDTTGNWTLYNGEGTTTFSSTNKKMGSYSCINPDDTNVVTNFNDYLSTSGDFTISLWMNRSAWDNGGVYGGGMPCTNDSIASGVTFCVEEFSSPNPTLWRNAETITTAIRTLNTWNNTIILKRGAVMEFWYDGKNIFNSTIFATSTANLLFGDEGQNGNRNFIGAFDNIQILNRAATPDEIATQLWNNGAGWTMLTVSNQNISITYSSSITELDYTSHTILFQNYNLSSNTTAFLTYNNTVYNATQSYVSANYTQFNVTVLTPLVFLNSTAIPFQWNYTFVYINGSTYTSNISNTTQSIIWYYFPFALNLPDGIEGDIANFSFNFSFDTTAGLGTISASFLNVSGTYYAAQTFDGFVYYNDSILLPFNQTGNVTQYNITVEFNVTYAGQTFLRNRTGSQNTYRMAIYPCGSITNTTTLNFLVRNETSSALINPSTLGVFFKIWHQTANSSLYREYSLNYTGGNGNYSACIYPTGTNYTTDAQMEYSATGFSEKLYYLSSYVLTNSTQYLNLYLTDSTTQVQFTVKDQIDNVVSNVIIKVLSYDLGTNTYKTTEIITTDNFGIAYGQIVLSTNWYKFILEYNGEVVSETLPIKITGLTKTFKINLGTDPFLNFNEVKNIAHSLTFTNSTLTFSFTWDDPSGGMEEGCLKVVKTGLNADVTLLNSCTASTAGTILFNLTSPPGAYTYTGTSYVNFADGSSFTLDSLSVSFDNVYKDYGRSGLFVTFMVVVTLAMVGLWSPVAAVVLMLVALFSMIALKMFYMGPGLLAAFIIISIIYIYRMGR